MYSPDSPGSATGQVGMQLSLVTEEYAEENPVGYARAGPNRDPYLPPLHTKQKTLGEILLHILKMLVGVLLVGGVAYFLMILAGVA